MIEKYKTVKERERRIMIIRVKLLEEDGWLRNGMHFEKDGHHHQPMLKRSGMDSLL